MCVAMAALPMIATAASTAFSVVGALQQGQAAKAQANYQAQVADNNAKIAQWQANDALERGKVAEDQQRLKTRQMLGEQTANMAASGFDLGDETSLSILGDTAMMGEMDAQTIKKNAAREAWGYQVQGANYSNSATLSRAAGENAVTNSYFSAGTSLLDGASKFGTAYSNYKSSSSKLPWQTAGNVKPSWMGGGYYT